MVRLLYEIGVPNLKPVTIYCDNQSAISIEKNPVPYERTKHIELDAHFTREKVLDGLLQLQYLPTAQQLANAFTKNLSAAQLQYLMTKRGLVQTTIPSLRGGIGDDTSSSTIPPQAG